jgi:hypothetical protein
MIIQHTHNQTNITINQPALLLVFEVEAEPRLVGNVQDANRIAFSLTQEWRDLLLAALEADRLETA